MLVSALAIIAFATAFHIHWMFGGQLGFSVSLPQQSDGTPVLAHRLNWWGPGAGAVALLLIVLSLLLLGRTGHLRLPLPRGVVSFTLVCVGVVFMCRALVPNRYVGFFKQLRTTRWAKYDTLLYSPLFLVLGLLILLQALN
jgi:hypothetical protein